ncbi:DNA primase [Plastoroseomonas hellenica]|uniref:DNA primase n=1 Tax=Plastoroseomonas hellenica TaxID=2687306 RepID=A0ABS5F1D5_9PROT|nr:DNA primase [Plastoroseomonas hellenica]MBR0643684.1 DNA primase [Plastoroseomonas hellenica]MBR0666359.1 DNA primase [Plastoroseomonas hellenica]
MALSPSFLDELRLRTPLPGLIGRRARLTRSGRNWKACCPFHNEKSPSFYVYDDHYHCFGCGAHGDAVSFVMQSEGAGFMEAVERLAAEAGLDVPKPTPEAAARDRRARDLHAVMAAAQEAFTRRLHLPEGRPALDYLQRRGLTPETIRAFGLGWASGTRGAIAADLKPEGVETAQLLEAGLVREGEGGEAPRDFFFGRVIFPIRDRRGRVIAFGGRTLGDAQPKYVNSPETPLFSKRRALFGLDGAKEAAFRGARVIAVEGYMDVIALHQAGFGAAVAPLGTALTAEQMQELWRLTPEPVLCFDGDAAGARAAARAAELALTQLAPERTLRLATLPAGEDPDTLVGKGGPAAFQAVLDAAQPLSEALFTLIAGGRPPQTPEARAALRHRLAAAAATIPDKALASEYRSMLLDRFFTARARPGQKPKPPRIARAAPDPGQARSEGARCALAILIRHPWLLPQVEEALALLDLPEGPATRLRNALFAWLSGIETLDSAALIDHLAHTGESDALAWAMRPEGLPQAAQAEAQPKEAEEGWWHFFLLLRGEADLIEDQRAAERDWIATNDPGAALRLQRLTEAIAAQRRGEIEAVADTAATSP